MQKILSFVVVGLILAGCSTVPVELPSNVKQVAGNAGSTATYLDKVDYSFKTDKPVSFSKVKLCVAENITNNEVQLKDSVGSFIGSYTGNYYEKNNTQVLQGKDILKYVDDESKTLIANVTTETTSTSLVPIIDAVRFELKIVVQSDTDVLMMANNITRAQKSTGVVANNGFGKVGTWAGARAPAVIEAMNGAANKVKQCISE